MVPLAKMMTSTYRLSVVTMSLSSAVWPQFLRALNYRILSFIEAFDSSVNISCMEL